MLLIIYTYRINNIFNIIQFFIFLKNKKIIIEKGKFLFLTVY
jgi:hypothetical protein